MGITLLKCPTCGAEKDQPCRTNSGRKKTSIHDTRPFALTTEQVEVFGKDSVDVNTKIV